MAAPTVRDSATSGEAANTVTHTVSLPASVAAGDTLVVYFALSDDDTLTWPGGWSVFAQVNSTSLRGEAACKKADGTEGGTTIQVTSSAIEESAHVSLALAGAADPTVTAPEATAGATGISGAPDPDEISPSGGADDYLVIAFCAILVDKTIDTYPANCPDNRQFKASSGTPTTSSTGMGIASAALTSTASFNPDTFLLNSSGYYATGTTAFYPGSGGSGGGGTGGSGQNTAFGSFGSIGMTGQL